MTGLLIAGHVLLTAWRLRSAWWWQDDLVLLGRAADRPLSDLLFSNYNGHVVPGTWAVAWLADATSSYGWGWAIGSICALVLLTDVALVALLVRLHGTRLAVVLPVVMWVSAGSMITPTLWWAAAMQWLPVTAALLLAWYHHLEYWRTQRFRAAVGAVLSVAFGLAFFEKAALIVGVLFLFTVLYGTEGGLLARLRVAVGRAPDYWAAHLVLVGAYAAVYLPVAHGASKASYALTDLAGLARHFVLNLLLPSVFGGPLEWFGRYNPLPAAPTWFKVTAWVLAAGVVLGSLWRRRGAWRAWVLLLAFTLITLTLLAVSRLGFYGEAIGLDGRYSSDVVAVTIVCFALALIPMQQPPDDGIIVIPATTAEQYRRRDRRQLLTRAVAAAGAAAVLVAGAVSAARYVDNWTPSPTKTYLNTLQQELRAHPDVPLFDQQAPSTVLEPTFGDDSRLSTILRPSGLHPRLQSWQTDLHLVDAAGRIRPGQLVAPPAASTTSHPQCTKDGTPLQIRLDGPPRPLSTWTMGFAYAINDPATVTMAFGLGKTEVSLEQGVHTLFVQTAGNGDTITVAAPPGIGVCISNLSLGTATIAG